MALSYQAHLLSVSRNSLLFNEPKPENRNPNSDKPGDNGNNHSDDNNSNFEPECSENKKTTSSYDYLHQPMCRLKLIDTENKSEWSDDWEEENFLKNLCMTSSHDKRVWLDKEQFKDNAHHLDVSLKTKILKTLDLFFQQNRSKLTILYF